MHLQRAICTGAQLHTIMAMAAAAAYAPIVVDSRRPVHDSHVGARRAALGELQLRTAPPSQHAAQAVIDLLHRSYRARILQTV